MKITHITSAHPRNDVRIFEKMSISLLKFDNTVFLLVADGLGTKNELGVNVVDVGRAVQSRLYRFLITPILLFFRSLFLKSDIYHLHDPDLIPLGVMLKLLGKRVIFDSHEDFPSQVLGKEYIPKVFRKFLKRFFILFERCTLPYFDAVIAATPYIKTKLDLFCPYVVVLNNYPVIDVTPGNMREPNFNTLNFCYIGGISKIRGILQILDSLNFIRPDATLVLCGKFQSSLLQLDCQSHSKWSSVNFMGNLNRAELNNVLCDSVLGLVLFEPLPNHFESSPNKMFEYMAAGIPIIVSNFPAWSNLINKYECGLVADYNDIYDIADKINFLLNNINVSRRMGANGRRAVLENFSWQSQESILIATYNYIHSNG